MSQAVQNIKSENKAGDLPVYPTALEHKQGVVVLQEWWGVNDQIKERAEEFYAAGFSAVVPDLYRGKVATDHEEAGHLMNGLDWPGAIQDIRAAAKFLLDNGCEKVGVVGYCMGGALSLASTVLIEELSAGVVYYGIPPEALADPKNLKTPIQLHFGNNDDLVGFADPTAVDALELKLKESGAEYDLHRYDGAGHAFTNAARPEAFHEPSYKLASERTYDFFKQKL